MIFERCDISNSPASVYLGQFWNESKPNRSELKDVEPQNAFPALYVDNAKYDSLPDRFEKRWQKIEMSTYVNKGKEHEREDMKFHMYCILWKDDNDVDKIKKVSPASSSTLLSDLGKLDASMPNVIVLPEKTASNIIDYCGSKTLDKVLRSLNWCFRATNLLVS